MKCIAARQAFVLGSAGAALLLLASVWGPDLAEAKTRKPKTEAGSRVVAHLTFGSLAALDMALQADSSNRHYLYVQHAPGEGISVIDISDPAKPSVVAQVPWPDAAAAGRLRVAGDLGFVMGSAGSAANPPGGDDVVIWDLSHPAAPRIVQRFAGVVRFVRDANDYVYVLNQEGLWVISAPEPAAPAADPGANYGG